MEKSVRESSQMKIKLADHDVNKDTYNSFDDHKEIDELPATLVLSLHKIRDSFLNSDIDIYLLANPYSGSNEAKSYTNL